MISKIVTIAALLVASVSAQRGGKWGGYPGIWDGYGQSSTAASSGGAASSATTASKASGIYGGKYGLYGGGLVGGYPGIWGGNTDSSIATSSTTSSGGAASAATATSGTSGISGGKYVIYGGGLYGSDLIGGYPGVWGGFRDSSDATSVATSATSSGGATYAATAAAGSGSSSIYGGRYGLYGSKVYGGGLIGGYPGIWGGYRESSAAAAAAASATSSGGSTSSAVATSASGLSGIYGGKYGLYGGGLYGIDLIGGYPGIWGGYREASPAAAAAASAASSGGVTSAVAASAAAGASDIYGGKYGLYGGGLYGGSLIGGYPVIWGGYGDSSTATASSASLGGATSTVAASGTSGISGGRYRPYGGELYGIDLIGDYPGIWAGYGESSAAAVAAASATSSGGATSAAVASSGPSGIYGGKYLLDSGRLYGGGLVGGYPGIWGRYGDYSAPTVVGSVASSGEAASVAATVSSRASGIYGGKYVLDSGRLYGSGLVGGYPGIWGRYGDSSAPTVVGSVASSGEAASAAASRASGIYGGRYGLNGGGLISRGLP